MQKIALFDIVHLAIRKDGVELSCAGRKVPGNGENIVCKAARKFFSYTGVRAGVEIVLEKKIPVAAGLGGGSSDAAAVLLGLDRLMGTGLELGHLAELGLQLGADVPFFVQKCTGAIATGIGESLRKNNGISGFWILLVNPGFAVSTKWVYENFPLTSYANPYILARGRGRPADFHNVDPELFEELGNDLEAVTIKRYPEIGNIKEELKRAGAAAALMSGSGPTVFGLFAAEEKAQRCYQQFAKDYGENVFLVRPYIS